MSRRSARARASERARRFQQALARTRRLMWLAFSVGLVGGLVEGCADLDPSPQGLGAALNIWIRGGE